MNISEILSKVDHTNLSVTATWSDIQALCNDGVKYGVASVCIPPSYVSMASAYLQGKLKICTVIGFPNGYSSTATKCFEAADAIKNGAEEIDMVINVAMLKDRQYTGLENEITAVKKACGEKILKVITETCLLTRDEKIKICEIVSNSGADFIKTSTGFSTGGATFDDIALFAEHKSEHLKIKAAGGIRSLEDAEKFIELGADRLGTSAIVKIVKSNGGEAV